MYSSSPRLIAAVVMTVTIAACGEGNAPVPTATAPTPTPAPRLTFALFGSVLEITPNGFVPMEGVLVDVLSCEASTPGGCGNSYRRVTTNTQGSYIMEGVYPGQQNWVWVDKAGFRLPEGVVVDGEGAQNVTVKGDTRFDIRLVRR